MAPPSPSIRRSLFMALALVCAGGWALDWPLAPARIAATFGTPAKGHFVAGIALAASDGLVRSVDEGELAFAFEEGSHPSGLPSTLGSYAIVEHPHEMAAVYSHLARASVSGYLTKMRASTILGTSGTSGWAVGGGLLFQVFDRRIGRWVNPLLVLPPLPDDKAPAIRSVALVRGAKTYVLGGTSSIPQGTYLITVDVVDPTDSPWAAGPLAPYAIRFAIDGIEVAKAVFDVAEGRGGRLALFPGSPKTFAELRTREGRYVLGERLLARGRIVLELIGEDASGNRRGASWSVSVE